MDCITSVVWFRCISTAMANTVKQNYLKVYIEICTCATCLQTRTMFLNGGASGHDSVWSDCSKSSTDFEYCKERWNMQHNLIRIIQIQIITENKIDNKVVCSWFLWIQMLIYRTSFNWKNILSKRLLKTILGDNMTNFVQYIDKSFELQYCLINIEFYLSNKLCNLYYLLITFNTLLRINTNYKLFWLMVTNHAMVAQLKV